MLRRGNRGNLVRNLQADLNRLKLAPDLSLETDGIFGAATEGRVRSFQQRHALQVDGVAGPKTLGRLEEMTSRAKSIPDSSPTPTAPRTPRAAVPGDLSYEQAQEFLREYSDDYERLRRGAGHRLDTFASWFNNFNDFQGLVSAIGVLDKSYGLATASTATSFFGVFVLTYTFLRDWERALGSGEVVYGYRAAAYAATAWAFERPTVDRSRIIRQRAVDMRGEERGRKLDEAWRESTDRVRMYLQTRTFDGSRPIHVKKAIQALYGRRPGDYCRDLLKEFDPLISAQHIAVWRDNHYIVYPN